MKNRLLGAALAAVMTFAPGCASPSVGGGNSASGSIGISRDDALLYAADADLDTLFVVDAKTQAVVSEIPVGRQPEKVLVGPDDTVYVTNRLDRSVSVIRRGDTAESARVAVGVEPVGLAASTDGKTLYVVNATSREDAEFGTLMAIDAATLAVKWELPVGHEPRGLTLLGDGKAAISLYKQGELVLVDLQKAKVTRSGTGLFEALNASAKGLVTTADAPAPRPFGETPTTARPVGLEAITASPDGLQLYVPSLIATDAVLNTGDGTKTPSPLDRGASGAGYGGGSCGTTAVAAPALLTFDGEGTPQVDDLATCTGERAEQRPPMLLTSPTPETPVQGPRAIALEGSGRFLFIANQESNNVSVVATTRGTPGLLTTRDLDSRFAPSQGSVAQLVSVGSGPTGVVVTHDGTAAFVFNAFDHSISRLQSTDGRVTNAGTTRLTTREALSAAAVAGRKLFFSATDARMNNPAMGISCATCHLEGREDGHVWNFPDGPRQTPSLQGRMMTRTAPFHWNGEFPDLLAFMSHTVTNRMGGQGVTQAMEAQVAAFIDSMPAADNPHRDTAPEVVQRGRAAFEKAQCDGCHGTETFTDNSFADVGTFVQRGAVRDDVARLPHGGLNTPSLLGVSRTAPYLHDGSASTLKARILVGKDADLHGKTSALSDEEVDDLVSYLNTL